MKLYIGTDHAGYELKESLKRWLLDLGHEVEDMGAYSFDPEDDYNEPIVRVARNVAANEESAPAVGGAPQQAVAGIILGGSGQGEAIQANRIKGARATVFYGGDLEVIRLSRQHNNSNILSLGARFLSEGSARDAVRVWLETPFSDEPRHKRRNDKIDG
ncbi:MAG: RpiB/LacA/LacB family sugar-phosphate isomerase [Candidatus Spechtbacterales bacterium]